MRIISARHLLFTVIFVLRNKVSSICVFPPEFEGEYVVQNVAVNSMIQYSTINITADSISPYGHCYSRSDSKSVIVVIGSEENPCFRCFNLQMVSKNVILLIHNEADINSKCSSSAETVRCPEDIAMSEDKKFESDFHSIILYKTNGRDSLRRNEFCPFDFFDGEIKFDYWSNDVQVCSGLESSFSQCPSGSSLNARFKGCNTPQQSTTYECIGHWHALNKHYLAVIEWINGTVPRYKCGTYQYENDGETKMTLKINNDCSSLSSKNGFTPPSKNQQIFKIQKNVHDFQNSATALDFPSWLHGQWQFLKVMKNQLIFRDQTSLKFYRMMLVNQLSDEKFIVMSRSQCGEENYKCLWIRKLDKNILEFQTSSASAEKLTSYNICNDEEYFEGSRWITQSRIGSDLVKTDCPINGKYAGQLPDNLDLCAQMTSSCDSDIMHFQIGPCDSTELYEKRVYQCLGQWTDKKSATVYTFTKRVDEVVNTYECFVGLEAESEKRIIIKEAGENCFKMVDPNNYGMEMNQTETCKAHDDIQEEIIVRPTKTDHSITYETDFNDDNSIDFKTAAPTRKTKTTKSHHKEDNSIENDIAYDTSIASVAVKSVINSCGLLLTVWAFMRSRLFIRVL